LQFSLLFDCSYHHKLSVRWFDLITVFYICTSDIWLYLNYHHVFCD